MNQGIDPVSPNTSSNADAASVNRPERPCDTCRKRKSRCVIKPGSTTCVLCGFHNQVCTFSEQPIPRSKRKSAMPDPSLGAKRRSLSERIRIDQLAAGRRLDYDYAELQGESLLKTTLGLQNHRHATYVGLTSEHDSKILALRPYDQSRAESNEDGSFRRVANTVYFQQYPDSESPDHARDVETLDAIEAIVSPHGEALIKLYFRTVHPSFPILHKKVYLEKYARSHREFIPPLLAAVYILALSWWDFAPELVDEVKPDVVDELENIAFHSLRSSATRPKLSTVQAGLLLLQKPNRTSIWQLTCQLVAIGQDLGLHRDCSTWHIPHWERGLRKRLAWALYMQSTWSSLTLGRPLHFPPSTGDWAVQTVMSDDFPESAVDESDEDGSTEVERGRTMFSAMISLTKVAAEVLYELYSTRAESEIFTATDRTKFVLNKVKVLQLKLKQWYGSLPESLRMSSNTKVGMLNSVGSLHASYYAAEITLHRAVLHSLTANTDPYLIQVCRSAAKDRLIASIELFNSLRAENLESFWYFASSYNFALTGVFAALCMSTSQDPDEAQYYQQQLQSYRWRLKVSGKNVEFLKTAVGILEKSVGSMLKRTERRISDGSLQAFMTALSPVAATPPEPVPYFVSGFEDYDNESSDFFASPSMESRSFLGL